MTVPGPTLYSVTRGEHSLSFFSVFLACFVVVLALAIFGAIFRMNWRSWFPGAENRDSLFGSVRSVVYGFMSLLP